MYYFLTKVISHLMLLMLSDFPTLLAKTWHKSSKLNDLEIISPMSQLWIENSDWIILRRFHVCFPRLFSEIGDPDPLIHQKAIINTS